jgi:hypothetical protein
MKYTMFCRTGQFHILCGYTTGIWVHSTLILKYCVYELESWKVKNTVFDDFQLKLIEVKRNFCIHIYIFFCQYKLELGT